MAVNGPCGCWTCGEDGGRSGKQCGGNGDGRSVCAGSMSASKDKDKQNNEGQVVQARSCQQPYLTEQSVNCWNNPKRNKALL